MDNSAERNDNSCPQGRLDWVAFNASQAPLFSLETQVGDVLTLTRAATSVALECGMSGPDVDDLIQQTFLCVAGSRSCFDPSRARNRSALVFSWAHQAAVWELRHALRKVLPQNESDLPQEVQALVEVRVDTRAWSPLQRAITREEFRHVCLAARCLTPVERRAFVRLVRECFGVPESIEEKSRSTLRGDRARMRSALRQELGLEEDAGAA
jgi:DNA-directed RNA polymerase specialized sigma24 family protein